MEKVAEKSVYCPEKISFWVGAIAILSGLALSIMSWLGVCTEACLEGHKYRIFGMPFEMVGFIYFPALAAAYFSSYSFSRMRVITSMILAAGLGAELLFILIQKYSIGQWCPLCLGIASTILIASVAYSSGYLINFQRLLDQGQRLEIKNALKHAGITFLAFVLGFFSSLIGVSKQNDLQLASTNLEQNLAFGNKDSNIEVFIFTSWGCPACHRLEPLLSKTIEPLFKDSKVIFIDHISDTKTLNFSPYNFSFMIYEKPHYFQLRKMMRTLGAKTDTPTEEEIEVESSKLGVHYRELDYSQVDLGIDYFKQLSNIYEISSLPTAVIVNSTTRKFKKLSGTADITTQKIQKAIEELKAETADNTLRANEEVNYRA